MKTIKRTGREQNESGAGIDNSCGVGQDRGGTKRHRLIDTPKLRSGRSGCDGAVIMAFESV